MASSKQKKTHSAESSGVKDQASESKRFNLNFDYKDTLNMLKGILLQGKGVVETIENTIQKTIKAKIAKGEITPAEGEQLFNVLQEKVKTSFDQFNEKIEMRIQAVLKSLHFITTDELNAMEEKIDHLSKLLDNLAAPKKTKRTTTRSGRKTAGSASQKKKKS